MSYECFTCLHYIMRYLNTVSSWFESLTASLLCPAAGLGERVPQDVPGGDRSRAGEAGQEGRTGVADQRDPANRLRGRLSCNPILLPRKYRMIDFLCSDNRLYFSHLSRVSHSASFVKHIVISSFIKDHYKKNQEGTFLCLLPCVSNIIIFSCTTTTSCSAWQTWKNFLKM